MKNIFIPIAVFMILMMASLFSVRHGYNIAKEEITADLNNALVRVVNNNGRCVISQDTIKAYRQLRASAADGRVFIAVSDDRFSGYLSNSRLRRNSFITFDIIDDKYKTLGDDTSRIYSDTMVISNVCGGESLAVRGYVRVSSAAIFSMSDQRLSSLFAVSALLWAIFSFVYFRKNNGMKECINSFGGLIYSDDDKSFYGIDKQPIHFTPMQYRLVMMFWNSPGHSLTKEEICSELWPKKDDANDTLYTLIKRLKPVIESKTGLSIVADRGKSYILETRKLDN